jgi:hypothetical protein
LPNVRLKESARKSLKTQKKYLIYLNRLNPSP